MQEKTKTKNVTKILDITPENFVVPEGEEHLYHCRIEVKKFNAETGERMSKPRLQVFGKKSFDNFLLHNLKKQGYTVDILHDPTEWLKNNEAKIKEAKEKRIAEQKAAEKYALKAEILAELKAAGILPDTEAKEKEKEKAKEEK